MAYEITNNKRGSSIIRAVEAGTYTITLNDLSTNTALEVVSSASIRRINWSTNGSITLARGATPNTLLQLFGSGESRFDDYGHLLANNSTGNVVITIATAGTVTLEVSKAATYTTDLDKLV